MTLWNMRLAQNCTTKDNDGNDIGYKTWEEAEAEKDVFDINKGFEAADKFMESLKNKINREDNA